jgi:hypothetical protein
MLNHQVREALLLIETVMRSCLQRQNSMGLTLVQRRFSIPLIVVSYKVQIKKALTNQSSASVNE